MKATLAQVLGAKGNQVVSVQVDCSVVDAVEAMTSARVGSVLVLRGESIVGIFTTSSALSQLVRARGDRELATMADVMRDDVIVGSPTMSVSEAVGTMIRSRAHFIAVQDGGAVLGVISTGDIARAAACALEAELSDLCHYVSGPSGEPSMDWRGSTLPPRDTSGGASPIVPFHAAAWL